MSEEIRPRLTKEEYSIVTQFRQLKDKGFTPFVSIDVDSSVESDKVKYSEAGDTSSLEGSISTTETDRVKILSEFMAQCNVDTSVWEVDRYVLNAWDVTMKIGSGESTRGKTYTNYQIKVFLKRKMVHIRSIETFIQSLYERKATNPVVKVDSIKSGIMYEICLFDNHFGKLCWAPETTENYDLKIAKKVFLEASDKFFVYAKSLQPEQILFPVGNDFLHIDNDNNTTTRGTKQDVEGRLPKIYDIAFEAVIETVEKLMTLAPVHMLWVKSNHDTWVSYFLCKAIEAYFRNNENVTIDVGPKSRKAYTWGKVFLGYEHGQIKPEKLPLLMMDEWPHEWANARFRELHVGHLHKRQEMVFTTVDTQGSVIYRRIPSLTSTDAWHYQEGFMNHTKAADAYVWHKEDGLMNSFPVYINQ